MPLVVLVDKNSASASEIVSGALQDLDRATLIGQRTFGKGLVQNVRNIVYGGHIKVTTSKYYLPSGRCIQAIDYSERQKGHELKKDTAGGILPDIVMDDSTKVDICYSLYIDHYFFDYATRYHRLHDSIAPPELFELTDDELEDFCRFLDERQFKYETETGKFFEDMLRMAKHEDIDSATIAQLEALEPVLTPDFREAIRRNKEEVKNLLGSEIILRYYYQKGQSAFNLRSDKEFHRALQELK
jgi:carboxyl-terminal processing protease